MSLTVFMALCILGLDLLIYVFFHRIYGDKRSAVARQVAAFKGQSPSHSASLHKKPFMTAKIRPIEGSAERQTAPANSHSGLPYGSANAKASRSRFLWPSTWPPCGGPLSLISSKVDERD